MPITLELLKEKNACENFIDYFKSLGKQKWDLLELVDRSIKDDKKAFVNFLFRFADESNFEKMVDKCIEEGYGLGSAFIYHPHLFTQETFEKVVNHQIDVGGGLYYARQCCKNLPFFKEVMEKCGVRV